MFSGLTGKLPTFKTRKALIVINLQNDSFQTKDGIVVCQPQDFVDRIKGMVPHFRRIGDLVWVRTEFQSKPAASGSGNSDEDGPGPASHDVPVDQAARLSLEEEMEDDGTMLQQFQTAGAYFPSSRAKAVMRRASAKTRAEQRNDQLQFLANDEDEDSSDAYLSKPRKGQPPRFFVPGTSGAAFTDGMRPLVNEEKDLVLIKHHYSAFDATPLLLSLRMRLVTHIYLCGCLSNVSIYSTAADAVRHGFEVTVVEDCMGYRSEAKHLDAMRQMADMLGVSGVDSEEIIDEVGRLEPPDAEIPIFTGPGLAGINPPQFLRAPTEKPKAKKPQTELEAGARENATSTRDHSSISPSPAITAVEDSERPVSAQPLTTASESSRLPRWQDGTRTTGDPKAAESRKSVLGPGDKIGEGDSKIIYDALPSKLVQNAFEMVCKEVEWQAMHHRNGEVPRRVAVQGEIDKSGSRPIYRHPADESPPLSQFSPTVLRIRDAVQKLLHQPFNHALIQLYRSGQDNISEHSDKTLDIVRGSSIVNVSLGAQRVMTLRTKKDRHIKDATASARRSQRIPLPHNSLFVLGPRTNRHWLHGIRPDKRQAAEKSPSETAFNGERISITLRHIGTFTDKDNRKIWGQGAVSKYRQTAGTISTTNSAEMEAMVIAFGKENQQINFDWDAKYGGGFDVINLVSNVTMLQLCGDKIADLRVMLSILERNVPCVMARSKPSETQNRTPTSKPKTILALSSDEKPIFRDTDEASSELVGDLAILFHLGEFYPLQSTGEISEREMHRITSRALGRITQANELLSLWQEIQGSTTTAPVKTSHTLHLVDSSKAGSEENVLEAFLGELEIWEEYADEADYMGGDFYATVDCAFWPVLNDIVENWEGWNDNKYPDLAAYHKRVSSIASVGKATQKIQELFT